MMLSSLLSLFSYFVSVEQCVLTYGVTGKGQPTRCGHTLTRCPLPGLASGSAPSTPIKAQRPRP